MCISINYTYLYLLVCIGCNGLYRYILICIVHMVCIVCIDSDRYMYSVLHVLIYMGMYCM